jgi:hypothetical protein
LNQEILSEQLLVEMEDRRRILVAATDVLTVLKRGSGERKSRGSSNPESAAKPSEASKREANRDVNVDRKSNPEPSVDDSDLTGLSDSSSQEDAT